MVKLFLALLSGLLLGAIGTLCLLWLGAHKFVMRLYKGPRKPKPKNAANKRKQMG